MIFVMIIIITTATTTSIIAMLMMVIMMSDSLPVNADTRVTMVVRRAAAARGLLQHEHGG